MKPRSVVVLLGAVLVVGGCSGGSNGKGSAFPTSTGPHSEAPSAAPLSSAAAVVTPDTTQTSELVQALRGVDVALTVDQQKAVSSAVTVCNTLRAGGDATTVIPQAFSPTPLSGSQVQAVQQAITSTFCNASGSSGGASPSPGNPTSSGGTVVSSANPSIAGSGSG